MTAFEQKLKNKILEGAKDHISDCVNGRVESDLAAITPGLCLQVHKNGRQLADIRLGRTHDFYDLASLTKIIFTVSVFMQLEDEGRIKVKDFVSSFLQWWPHKSVRIEQVLSHTAGLPWWAPFHKELNLKKTILARREDLRKKISRIERTGKGLRSPGGRAIKAVYSDIDFILLGFLLEEVLESSLIEIWGSLTWREFASGLHFNVNNKPKYKRSSYAPTEKCPWRKKILQGEVHDDNTWSFGGVSSHAGLFGSIDDVAQYGLLLRQAYRNKKGSELASHKTVRHFTHRAILRNQGDWALGFVMPTRGAASCGKYFHSSSFGHTGFTGTSLWYDPTRDLLVTILSNRVHPTRENTRYVQFRPKIHDWIVELL